MNSFGQYIQRQCYKRKRLFEGISRAKYYRRIKNPEELTIQELRWLIRIGELDINEVMRFIENE